MDDLTKIDLEIARLLPESIARRLFLVAIGELDNKVVIAMADPLNIVAIDTVTVKIRRMVRVVVSPSTNIEQAIDGIYHGSDAAEQRLRDLVSLEEGDDDFGDGEIDLVIEEEGMEGDSSEETEANQAPVIRFVDLLMSQAVKSRASDIHIEPQEK